MSAAVLAATRPPSYVPHLAALPHPATIVETNASLAKPSPSRSRPRPWPPRGQDRPLPRTIRATATAYRHRKACPGRNREPSHRPPRRSARPPHPGCRARLGPLHANADRGWGNPSKPCTPRGHPHLDPTLTKRTLAGGRHPPHPSRPACPLPARPPSVHRPARICSTDRATEGRAAQRRAGTVVIIRVAGRRGARGLVGNASSRRGCDR